MSVLGILDAMRCKDMPSRHRWVWACLENHANGHRFWPMTCQEIADELGFSINTVTRAIADLEERAVIRREFHHRRKTVFHMLRVYDKPELAPQNPHPNSQREPELAPQNSPPISELAPQNLEPEPELAPQNQGDIESTSKNPPVKTPPGGKTRGRATPADVERVVTAWNEMAVRTGLPGVRAMSAARSKHLANRVADHGVDGMLQAIEEAEASGFCRGENDRGWVAGFDFVLQPKSCLRLLEGFYRNRTSATATSRMSQAERNRAELRASSGMFS